MPVIPSGFDSNCPSSQLGNPFQTTNPIAVGTSPVKLLDPNPKRKEMIVINTGTTVLALAFGSQPNYSTGVFHVLLAAGSGSRDGSGGSFVSDMWQGSVWIVGSAASGECVLTEMI